MGRDTWKYRAQEREREKRMRPNPILRGVGCLLLTGLAIFAYLFSGWFFTQNAANGWVYIPPEVIRPPFAAALPPGLLAQLVVTLLAMVLSYGILSLVYAIAFPIKPGETDAPPMRRSDLPRRR